MVALLSMAVFLLIEISIQTNMYEFSGCVLGSIPDCGFRQFKFAALIIFSCFTIVMALLTCFGFKKYTFEVNMIIGIISILAVIINIFAILGNDYYKSLTDKSRKEAFFWSLMGEISLLTGMTGATLVLYEFNRQSS